MVTAVVDQSDRERIEKAANQLMEISDSLEQENRRLDFDTLRNAFNWNTSDDALYVFSMIESESCNLFEAVMCLDFKKDALEQLRMEYEKTGDANLVLAAIDQIVDGRGSSPAPDWVRNAWREAYRKWRTLDAKSLDEAFGIRRTHIKALRKKQLGHEIYHYVEKLRNEGTPLDDQLFEEAAGFISAQRPADLAVNKSTVNALYYEERAKHKRILSGGKLDLLAPFIKKSNI